MSEPDPAPSEAQQLRDTLRGHALAGAVTAGFAWLLWMIAGAMEVRVAEIAAVATLVGSILYAFTAMVFAVRLPRPAPRVTEEDEA